MGLDLQPPPIDPQPPDQRVVIFDATSSEGVAGDGIAQIGVNKNCRQ
jgi:hypothetical protein